MSHLLFECPIFHEKRMMMCNVIESHIPTWSHTDIDEKCICIWYLKCWYPVSLTRNIGQDNSCAITASLFRNLSCWQRLVQPVKKSWDRISLVLWNIALKPPVWETRSGIYCIEGPSEFYTLSAEMWLAVSGGQPLVYFGLPMFAVSLIHQIFKKIHVGLKLEWGSHDKYWLNCERLPFEVYFSCPFDVLLGVTYANMLVATQWPLKRAPHLTFLAWVCVIWMSESSLELSALWVRNYFIYVYVNDMFLHRQLKVLVHLLQWESLSKHQIRNAISRQPNFSRLYTTRYFN